jgi:hypothetical protein
MGSNADADQATSFKVVDLVGHGGYNWELDRRGFFRSGTTILGESANEGREARFMVFTIKLGLVPFLERCLHW